MTGKLVTLVALFTLVLAATAFASPADRDMAGELEAGTGAGAIELEARVGDDHAQEEEAFVLYLGPLDESIAEVGDRRVD